MASVFMSYSSGDRELIHRIAESLYSQAAQVWLDEQQVDVGNELSATLDQAIAAYDFFCIGISRTSVASRWVHYELETALDKEASEAGGLVVPLLLQPDVEVPSIIAGRESVDFTGDFSDGLQSLLSVLSRANIRSVEFPNFTIVSARRGTPTRLQKTAELTSQGQFRFTGGSVSPIGTASLFSEDGGVILISESIGIPEGAAALSGEIGTLVGNLFVQGTMGADPMWIQHVFRLADTLALNINNKHKLTGNRRVSAKLAMLVAVGRTIQVASIGTAGIVCSTTTGIGERVITPISSGASFKVQQLADSNQSASFIAPLGYLADGSCEVTPTAIHLECPGDYVALTTFTLPSEFDIGDELWGRLHGCTHVGDVAETLTSWHWPPLDECLTCVVTPRF
jgi:hypothetical protein